MIPPHTWNDLQDSVLLHVGGQVARSHLVILNLDGCQFLEIRSRHGSDFDA